MWNKHAVEVGLSGYQIVSCDASEVETEVYLQNVVLQNGYSSECLSWYHIIDYQGSFLVYYGPKNAKEYAAYNDTKNAVRRNIDRLAITLMTGIWDENRYDQVSARPNLALNVAVDNAETVGNSYVFTSDPMIYHGFHTEFSSFTLQNEAKADRLAGFSGNACYTYLWFTND